MELLRCTTQRKTNDLLPADAGFFVCVLYIFLMKQVSWAVLENPQGTSYVSRCKLFTSIFDAMDFMYSAVNVTDLELLDLETTDREILDGTPHVLID